MRSISQAITDTVGAEDVAKASSPATQMLLSLAATGKHVYEGTVPHAVKLHRRPANRRARAARRTHR